MLGRLKFDINLAFLMETFFIKAMLDQHIGKEAIVPTTMAIPMLMYLFGKLLAARVVDFGEAETETNEKAIANLANKSHIIFKTSKTVSANITMLALAVGTLILGLLNFNLTRKSPVAIMGYYSVAFTGDTFYTDVLAYYFNFIFMLAIIAGLLTYFVYKLTDSNDLIKRYRGLALAVIYVLLLIAVAVKYIGTERFLAFKQGVGLMITQHWGNFGLELTYNNSTSNMWLDYGRDYGILVFGTLLVFFILTIKDLIKLAINKNVGIFAKTVIILAFTGTNIYYFIDSFAYIYPQYWYVGLIVCGVLSEAAKVEGPKQKAKSMHEIMMEGMEATDY